MARRYGPPVGGGRRLTPKAIQPLYNPMEQHGIT